MELFDHKTQADPTEARASSSHIEDLEKLYQETVGEGKRFKDPQKLLKSKLDADQHISRIESENAQLRADLNARLSLEEAITRLSKTGDEPTKTPSEPDGTTTLTPEAIAKLIDERLNGLTQKSTLERNQEKVLESLRRAWGDAYSQRLSERAADLGLGKEFLTDLAQKQPDAFLKLVLPKAEATTQVPTSTIRAPSNPNSTKNWAYYSKMRRENPKLYHQVSTQKEIHDMARKLGEDFFK